jgi:hypothetical protein
MERHTNGIAYIKEIRTKEFILMMENQSMNILMKAWKISLKMRNRFLLLGRGRRG